MDTLDALNQQYGHILALLKGKAMHEWTREEDIEKELSNEIHYYEVRKRLKELTDKQLIEYSRNGCSYKITNAGRSSK